MLHPCVCVALRSTTSTSAGNAAAVAILKTAQACLTNVFGKKKNRTVHVNVCHVHFLTSMDTSFL